MTFSFIQIADPQFGMYSQLSGVDNPAVDRLANLGLMVERVPKVEGMGFETANHGKVIDAANRLRPAFVVTCGDMTNNQDDPIGRARRAYARHRRALRRYSDALGLRQPRRARPADPRVAGPLPGDVRRRRLLLRPRGQPLRRSEQHGDQELGQRRGRVRAAARVPRSGPAGGERERQPPHGRVHPPPAVPRLPGGGQQLAGTAAGAQAANGRPVPRNRRHPCLFGPLAPQPPRLLRGAWRSS